jgi:hypothetical protein
VHANRPMLLEYTVGDQLPDVALTWRDWRGALIPLATGHTFEIRVAAALGEPALLVKTGGITGADVDPNVRIVWSPASHELGALDPGLYVLLLAAIRPNGARRTYPPISLVIKPGIV